jgi:hypothetical protein
VHAAETANLEGLLQEHQEPMAARRGCFRSHPLLEHLEVEACQTQALDPLSSLSKHTRLSDFIYTIVS